MAPVVIAKMANAPSPADVLALSETIFTTTSSQASLDASYALADLFISSTGFSALTNYGIIEEIKRSAADKKNAARREGSMFLLGALFERFPPKEPASEVTFLLEYADLVPITLDCLADKGSSVREGAVYALDVLYNNLKPESLTCALLPILVKYLGKRSGKWQGTVGAYQLLGKMADKAKLGMGTREEEMTKDVLREAMGKRLDGLIPVVEAGMHDLKPEVSGQPGWQKFQGVANWCRTGCKVRHQNHERSYESSAKR